MGGAHCSALGTWAGECRARARARARRSGSFVVRAIFPAQVVPGYGQLRLLWSFKVPDPVAEVAPPGGRILAGSCQFTVEIAGLWDNQHADEAVLFVPTPQEFAEMPEMTRSRVAAVGVLAKVVAVDASTADLVAARVVW